MTDPIKDAAAQIRAMPDYDAGLLNDFGGGNVDWWQDYLRAEIGRANDHWREAAAALVEAMPQAVAGRWETTSEHIARDMAEGRFPGHSERKWLTPTAVADSPAPDPVSKTPALDAMAMQRAWYTAGIRAAALRYRAGSGPDSWDYFALAEAAILDLLTFERVEPPLPTADAVLAEALQLPEVKALVEAMKLLEVKALVDVLTKVPRALNQSFSAGMEEREYGSAKRQAKCLEFVDAVRAEIDAALKGVK